MNKRSSQGAKSYRSGHFAETLALWWLRCKGYRKLAVNYSTGKGTHAGEVDLIVCRGKTVVFVEVKKRAALDQAAEAIFASQQQRIRRGAEAFLNRYPVFANYNLRFDAVLVKLPFTICHLENAF